MSKRKINSRALRQLADDLFRRVAGDDEFPEGERADFVTSLVRQWITYDGNATLFLGDRQVYLVLGRTPLGNPCVVPEPGLSGWVRELTEDWKVSPDDIPDILGQLNLGQSAEAVNGEGIPLRLWVDPKERGRGVEPLVKEDIPPGAVRDYRKIAASELLRHFGAELGPEETDELACSMASQWQQFDGHACLFIDGYTQFHFKLTELGNGGCKLDTSELRINLDAALLSFGFTPDVFPEVIARLNLGQQIEFRDRQGVRFRLWHDPKARRLCHQPLDPVRSEPMVVCPPFLCPKCTAVLLPWRSDQRKQSCPICGHTVSLS